MNNLVALLMTAMDGCSFIVERGKTCYGGCVIINNEKNIPKYLFPQVCFQTKHSGLTRTIKVYTATNLSCQLLNIRLTQTPIIQTNTQIEYQPNPETYLHILYVYEQNENSVSLTKQPILIMSKVYKNWPMLLS